MTNPYDAPAAALDRLPQPPSAKSSKTFGILGLCSHLLCLLGAPFAIIFGILALVRHSRAKREHAANPEAYAPPRSTGLVTGIVALALLVTVLPATGMVAAISIPALLAQRERARTRAVEYLVYQANAEIARTADELRAQTGARPDPEAVVQAVLARPEFQAPKAKNPYGGTESPFRLAEEPANLGEVALWPEPEHQGSEGTLQTAVVVRGRIQRGGAPITFSRVVVLD
jgi:hypothetical protein